VDISLGGILVRPGDWVVGDRDGIVVIPENRIRHVLAAADTRLAKETRIAELAKTGVTVLEANVIATQELAAAARVSRGSGHVSSCSDHRGTRVHSRP
jgi:regulator of RNase E activity RraA